MKTLPAVEKFTAPADLDHVVCLCSEYLALCGVQLDESYGWISGAAPINCVDCLLLDEAPCPRCGA